MVEMDKRKFGGVIVKAEPKEIGSVSDDSFEEKEVTDNGHVNFKEENSDEYSEMTFDDLIDFDPENDAFEGEPTLAIVIDHGVAEIAAGSDDNNSLEVSLRNLSNDEVDFDMLSKNANKTEICHINQMDSILFKARDEISKFNPSLVDNLFHVVEKKVQVDNKSDNSSFLNEFEKQESESKTGHQTSAQSASDSIDKQLMDRSSLISVKTENSDNGADDIFSKDNVNSDKHVSRGHCTESDKNLTAVNNVSAAKQNDNLDKSSADCFPANRTEITETKLKNPLMGDTNESCVLLKKECNQDESQPKHTNDTDKVLPSSTQCMAGDKADLVMIEDSSEDSEMDSSSNILSKDFSDKDSGTRPKRRRRRRRNWQMSDPFLHSLYSYRFRPHSNNSVAKMQMLCDSLGQPAVRSDISLFPTNSNSDKSHINIGQQQMTDNNLNRNAVTKIPSQSNIMNQQLTGNCNSRFHDHCNLPHQGVRLQGQTTDMGMMNPQGWPSNSYNHPNFVNQVPGRASGQEIGLCQTSDFNNSMKFGHNTQVQNSNNLTPCIRNSTQGSVNQTSQFHAQMFKNTQNHTNSSQAIPQSSGYDFQQSLDNFNVDWLDNTQVSTQNEQTYSKTNHQACNQGGNILGYSNQNSFPSINQQSNPHMNGAIRNNMSSDAISGQSRSRHNFVQISENDASSNMSKGYPNPPPPYPAYSSQQYAFNFNKSNSGSTGHMTQPFMGRRVTANPGVCSRPPFNPQRPQLGNNFHNNPNHVQTFNNSASQNVQMKGTGAMCIPSNPNSQLRNNVCGPNNSQVPFSMNQDYNNTLETLTKLCQP